MGFNKDLFDISELSDRIVMVNQHGSFITTIRYYAFKISLYQVEQYLIEVFLNSHNETIEYVELFDMNESRVNLYSSTVDISNLFKA